jgi:hypothetical protein
VALIGCFTISFISFIFPPIAHLQLCRTGECSQEELARRYVYRCCNAYHVSVYCLHINIITPSCIYSPPHSPPPIHPPPRATIRPAPRSYSMECSIGLCVLWFRLRSVHCHHRGIHPVGHSRHGYSQRAPATPVPALAILRTHAVPPPYRRPHRLWR